MHHEAQQQNAIGRMSPEAIRRKSEEEHLRNLADAALELSMADVPRAREAQTSAVDELDESWQALMSLVTMDQTLAEEQTQSRRGKNIQVRMPRGARSPARRHGAAAAAARPSATSRPSRPWPPSSATATCGAS